MIAISEEFPRTESNSRIQYDNTFTPLVMAVSLAHGLQSYSLRSGVTVELFIFPNESSSTVKSIKLGWLLKDAPFRVVLIMSADGKRIAKEYTYRYLFITIKLPIGRIMS